MKQLVERLRRTWRLVRVSRGRYWRASMVHAPYEVRCNSRRARLLAPDDPGALACFFEVYVEDVYDLRGLAQSLTPKVIADIGANFGAFSVWSRLMFPESKIYAYEPNPAPFAWLEKNREAFGFTTVMCAVSNESGVMRFDAGAHSTLGMISPTGEFEVPVIGPADVAEGRAIDLLKVDCEGGEWTIFEDPALLRRCEHLAMEFHIIDQRGLDDLVKLIETAGHKVNFVRWIGAGLGLLRSQRRAPGVSPSVGPKSK